MKVVAAPEEVIEEQWRSEEVESRKAKILEALMAQWNDFTVIPFSACSGLWWPAADNSGSRNGADHWISLSGTEVGILNAIPVFALVAVPLAADRASVRACVDHRPSIAAALAARLRIRIRGCFTSRPFMAAGIAVMQPSLPPTVRQWVPNRIGFATAVYTNGLLCGEIFPVAFAGVLLPLLAGSWRASLVLWSIPLVVIAIIIFLLQPGGKSAPVSRHHLWMPDWRDPLLWKVGIIMSAANQLYFCTNAFLPGFLLQTGRTDLIGPALTALNVGQLPASFILLAMASRWERRKWPLLAAVAIGVLELQARLHLPERGALSSAAMTAFACAVILDS